MGQSGVEMMLPIEHIHPILVHFPIVLLPIAVVLDTIAVSRHGNLGTIKGLSAVSLVALTVGTLAALAAALFGSLAMEVAVQKGYTEALFEDHESLAWTTVSFFGALTCFRAYAWRREINLAGVRGWSIVAAGMLGVTILIATAFHGGELVYNHGVNVAAASIEGARM
jgi:uncharacterized membrane protein